jgi:hypothetical protein
MAADLAILAAAKAIAGICAEPLRERAAGICFDPAYVLLQIRLPQALASAVCQACGSRSWYPQLCRYPATPVIVDERVPQDGAPAFGQCVERPDGQRILDRIEVGVTVSVRYRQFREIAGQVRHPVSSAPFGRDVPYHRVQIWLERSARATTVEKGAKRPAERFGTQILGRRAIV